MESFIEPLYKSKDEIKFAWAPEDGAASYKVYVGLVPSGLSLLAEGLSNRTSELALARGKVLYIASASDVQALLSLTTEDFSDTVFYWAITYVNSAGSESALADSTVVEVPPVGILPKLMKDDPSIRRHPFVFSDDLQRWTKAMGSSSGAQIVDSSDFYKMNMTTEYTYDGTDMSTSLSYMSDATTGSPAKLTTYTYVASQLTKVEITDTTATI